MRLLSVYTISSPIMDDIVLNWKMFSKRTNKKKKKTRKRMENHVYLASKIFLLIRLFDVFFFFIVFSTIFNFSSISILPHLNVSFPFNSKPISVDVILLLFFDQSIIEILRFFFVPALFLFVACQWSQRHFIPFSCCNLSWRNSHGRGWTFTISNWRVKDCCVSCVCTLNLFSEKRKK